MKQIIFAFLLIFLMGCQIEIEQTVENITNTTVVPEVEAIVEENIAPVQEVLTKPADVAKETETQQYNILDPSKYNASVSSKLPAKKWIKGKDHIIEVIDVTEGADACIIKVDDVSDLIKVGETKTLNGVKIFVSDAFIFNSFTEDNDVCELVIV